MRRILSSAACLSFVFLACALAQGQEKVSKKGGEEYIEIDLNGVNLDSVMEIVQKQTGKVFLFEDKIRQIKVYMKGSTKIPKAALFSVFKSILELNGYSLVRTGSGDAEVIKILDRNRIKSEPTPTFSGDQLRVNPEILPGDEEMVTVVYHLRYAESRIAANSLRQVVNQQFGNILPIPNVNVLVITDLAPNMKRVCRILDLIDTPGEQLEWEVVRLKWADAEETASKIDSVIQVQRQFAQLMQVQLPPAPKIVADTRTRSLVLQGASDDMRKIKILIERLDVALDEEPSYVHIYKLRHTSAKGYEKKPGMVDTVNAIINANPELIRTLGRISDDVPQPSPGGLPMPGGGVAPVPRPPSVQPTPSRPASSGSEKPQALAIADEATNSLIVVAPEAYYRELRKIIDELDVRRPQVLIEMAIIEVSTTKGADLGAELAAIDRAAENSTRGFLATQFGLSNMVDKEGNPISLESPGIPVGRQPKTGTGMLFGLSYGSEFKIPVLLTLIGKESDLTILSMPRILTNENEEAEIKALNQVPTTTTSSNATISQQVSFGGFQDAGITLKITPHISENKSLRLEIEQKIEEFAATESSLVGGIALPPAKTTRQISNTVTVPNHKTVVLGGLTSTAQKKSITKIPLLGDIPILGLLFRYESQSTTKRNLFIFITPHILSSDDFDDLERISGAALDEAALLGAPTGDIDANHRKVYAADSELDGMPAGKPVASITYRPAKGE